MINNSSDGSKALKLHSNYPGSKAGFAVESIGQSEVVHYYPEESGKRPTLVLYPGLGCKAGAYQRMQRSFADLGYESVAVTLFKGNEYVTSVAAMQRQMAMVTKALNKPVICIGHSASAFAGIDMLAGGYWDHPTGFVGMTCSTFKGQALGWPAKWRMVLKYGWQLRTSTGSIEMSRSDAIKLMLTGMKHSDIEYALEMMGPMPKGVLLELGKEIPIPDREKINVPCLIIGGRNDITNPDDHQREIAQKIGADHRLYSGPHMVPLAGPDQIKEVVTIINEWITSKQMLRHMNGISPK